MYLSSDTNRDTDECWCGVRLRRQKRILKTALFDVVVFICF